jgi:hypothetical protein
MKKKEKRTHDPARQSYIAMLAHNDGKHEADSEASSVYELERGISADEEAHRVAAAIGLPAAFDPTIKPYTTHLSTPRRVSSPSGLPSPSSIGTTSRSPPPPTLRTESGDEESDDENDEFEVEAISTQRTVPEERKTTALEREQKQRLHAMEVGEAAALLKSGKQIEDDDDDDESLDRTENTVKH